jgi:hypothetical protein
MRKRVIVWFIRDTCTAYYMLHIATYKITWKLKFNGSERESEFGENEKKKIENSKTEGKIFFGGGENGVGGRKKFGRGRKNGVCSRTP